MPHDELVKMPDGGYAFVRFSGPRRPRHKCSACAAPWATLQCDFPIAGGKTCDKHLCRGCGVRKGKNVDWCPDHE